MFGINPLAACTQCSGETTKGTKWDQHGYAERYCVMHPVHAILLVRSVVLLLLLCGPAAAGIACIGRTALAAATRDPLYGL